LNLCLPVTFNWTVLHEILSCEIQLQWHKDESSYHRSYETEIENDSEAEGHVDPVVILDVHDASNWVVVIGVRVAIVRWCGLLSNCLEEEEAENNWPNSVEKGLTAPATHKLPVQLLSRHVSHPIIYRHPSLTVHRIAIHTHCIHVLAAFIHAVIELVCVLLGPIKVRV